MATAPLLAGLLLAVKEYPPGTWRDDGSRAADPDAASKLPPDLADARLSSDDPFLGSPRFLPQSGRASDELLSSVFASWNLLDAQMYAHEPRSAFQTGYLREVQVRRMLKLILQPHVKTYCEVGMNGGHSLVAMLLAKPTLAVHVFDLFKWEYSVPVANLVNHTFRGRVTFHRGYSQKTLPAFVRREAPPRFVCDVMLVDGGHSQWAASSDIKALRAVANRQTRAVMDDIGMNGPGSALMKLNASGMLHIEELYGPFPKDSKPHNPCMRVPPGTSKLRRTSDNMCPEWGFAVVSYNHPAVHQYGSNVAVRDGAGGAGAAAEGAKARLGARRGGKLRGRGALKLHGFA